MNSAEHRRVEPIEGPEAARAIKVFAEAVRRAPGVWAVTVRALGLQNGSFDMHLVVHGEFPDGAEPLAPLRWWHP